MGFFVKIRSFILKLQHLPDEKKKIVFFAIMIFVSVVVIFFGTVLTLNDIAKISRSLKSTKTAKLETPKNNELNNEINSLNNSDNQRMPEDAINNSSENSENQNQITPSLSEALATENWIVYQNKKHGYQIKHPKEWFVGSCNKERAGIEYADDACISPASPEDSMIFINEAFRITAKKANYSSLQEETNALFAETNFTQEKLKIDGVDALKIETMCEAVGCGAPMWILVKNDKVYEISTGLSSDKHVDVFSQMLSTFKFID